MARLLIRGKRPLVGTFRPSGNKNAALPMLAASLLTDEPLILHGVPRIRDVCVMIELLEELGVDVSWQDTTVRLQAARVSNDDPDPQHCRRIRASILLAGPLCVRRGHVRLPPPGGDIIGRRRLDSHIAGLQALGATASVSDTFHFSAPSLTGTDILLDEASVTATENLLMAASLAGGKTTLYHAACEPHVEDLGHLLRAMGATIHGLGTNLITIEGTDRLRGAEHFVQPDYIEVGSFAAAAAVTGGDLEIEGFGDHRTARILQRGFAKLGMDWQLGPHQSRVRCGQTFTVQSEIGRTIPTLEDGIWPAFPSDLLSVAIVLATQAHGSVLFFEKLFESRLYFVDRLIEMGAQIIQCDPHRVVVQGPTSLHAIHMSSPDIRAGMAMVVAALCAEGESIIENAGFIDRGYENIEGRLRELGADVVRDLA